MRHDIVVIGAPVGGASALVELANSLPPDLPAAVLMVLHAHPETSILLADALSAPGHMRASEAIDGEPLERNRIYVAADGTHLTVDERSVRLREDTGKTVCCPSIDVLFESAAEHYKKRVLGVALVHLASDGIFGLASIRRHGGRTITHRNEQMQEAPLHPRTGQALAHHHLELNEIAERVVAYVNGRNGVEAVH